MLVTVNLDVPRCRSARTGEKQRVPIERHREDLRSDRTLNVDWKSHLG
jgi:hypothetical protein